ncbi:MAG TPA: hypothetical protein VL993_10040 [Stellaceae bacterium]|nr:hypothetical protein [Stellaceae bacterium]
MRAGMLLALALSMPQAGAAELAPILGAVQWGESADAIARAFGPRAIRLTHPIEFGDSYVTVALRDQSLGGYPFAVYFQMDITTHGLKRVMLERQRHGANPLVFRAVVDALDRDYGPPSDACHSRATRRNGFQAEGARVWYAGGDAIRAVFADTTIEAEGGCAPGGAPCGLTGHLFVQILPRDADDLCG